MQIESVDRSLRHGWHASNLRKCAPPVVVNAQLCLHRVVTIAPGAGRVRTMPLSARVSRMQGLTKFQAGEHKIVAQRGRRRAIKETEGYKRLSSGCF
jgi:hypothetical protein